MKNQRIWRGLSSILASLLVIAILSSMMAFKYDTMINNFLGITTTRTKGGEDAIYYPRAYASDEELMAAARAFSIDEMAEGAVLLKNDGTLPLQDVKKVTLLGRASFDIIHRNGSAGQGTDAATVVTFRSGLEAAGIAVNPVVYDAYSKSTTTRISSKKAAETDIGEEPVSFYTDALVSSFADYNDAAVIVLSRTCGEGIDASMSDFEGISQLALHKNEADLLKLATQHFSKIIVLINSGNAMELDWLDEYGVNACMLVGTVGNFGCEAIVSLLTGKINPSGHLVDTYAASSLSSAAVQNFGSITYTNAKDYKLGLVSRTGLDVNNRYVVNAEGIYVGYKYYETRYEDIILGQGNADSTVGVFTSKGNWNYAEEVTFPFGYGLSYTAFEQKLDRVIWDGKAVTAEVTVTNTGNVVGKSVVQLYIQTPYTDYDRENLVEKSAIQLAGFGKTGSLDAGASETVTIKVDEYLFASYDYTKAQSYILDAGDYYFAIGDDAHDALNNVLAAKGASGMTDAFGNAVSGNADKTVKFTRDTLDTTTYKTSQYTGTTIKNELASADINTWIPGTVTYLTRQDWNTFPKKVDIAVTEEMAVFLKTSNSKHDPDEIYIKPADAPSVASVVTGADYGEQKINFIDMLDVPYEDDEKWDKFIDQLTIEDLVALTNHGAAVSVGKPATRQGDGPDGANNVQFCGEMISTCSFNPDIMTRRGEMMAELDKAAGIAAHWAPGGDIHRTPFSGRNFEYFSEDSIMSYLAEAYTCKAMQEKGLMAMPKHFCGNDQETNRNGICVWSNEQAWREIQFKGFEGAFTVGGAMGTMTAYNRYGMIYTAESDAANNQILRDEWGFKGATITDGGSGSTLDMFINGGTDISCLSDRTTSLMAQINELDDGLLVQALKRNAKHIIYADLRSSLINGLASNTVVENVTPWWVTAIIAADSVLGAITLCALILYLISLKKVKKAKKAA